LLAGLQQARVSFLHEVVDIEVRGKFCAQAGAKLRFVGLHLFGKPAGCLGIRRGHCVVVKNRLCFLPSPADVELYFTAKTPAANLR
jgi:hypothetical protein